MKNLIERLARARAARLENRESGFSMIELIVVIAIIGILIAVAIPVYGNIQQTAKDNQLKNAAAAGANVAAATLAQGGDAAAVTAALAKSAKGGEYTLAIKMGSSTSVETVCVVATAEPTKALKDGVPAESGAGCTL